MGLSVLRLKGIHHLPRQLVLVPAQNLRPVGHLARRLTRSPQQLLRLGQHQRRYSARLRCLPKRCHDRRSKAPLRTTPRSLLLCGGPGWLSVLRLTGGFATYRVSWFLFPRRICVRSVISPDVSPVAPSSFTALASISGDILPVSDACLSCHDRRIKAPLRTTPQSLLLCGGPGWGYQSSD